MGQQPIYLLVFYTEGFPHDEGYDLSKTSNDIKRVLSGVFTDIFDFTPRKLKKIPGSDNFCNSFGSELLLNPGLDKVGNGDFKSFLIHHFLKQIPENSILIYHDSNFEKYPQYWQTDWIRIRETCNFLMDSNSSDFFIPWEERNFKGGFPLVKHFGKRYTTEFFFKESEIRNIIEESPMITSNRIIIRNTSESRKFFHDYNHINENKDLLSKWPNPSPHPEFIHHCPEQHTLNLLVYKYILDRKLEPTFPKFRFLHRKMRLDDSLEEYQNLPLLNYMKSKK